MRIKAVVFAFLANAIAMYNVSFFSSFLAIRLKEQYAVKDENMGYYFAILSFSYLSSAILCPMIFANCPRKLQFVICFFITTIAMGLMGPTQYLNLDDTKIAYLLTGLPMLGFIQALCFIPSLPEAIEAYQLKYKIVQNINPALDGKLSDIMSSGYGLFYNLSSLLGPICGGVLYDNYAYENTLNINMFMEFGFFLIFAIFNCGIFVFKHHNRDKKLMADMKDVELAVKIHEDIEGANGKGGDEDDDSRPKMFAYSDSFAGENVMAPD